jgi:hypothetical protein
MSNIYVDGHGLGMTKMILQKQSGTSWQNSTKYDQNQKHRFRMLFHNYYSSSIPSGGSAFGNCDIHIADLFVKITLPGARFDGWQQDHGQWPLMPAQVDGHPNFNDTIKPMTSRWFEFASFTWLKPDAAVSSIGVQVCTFHREILHIPFAPWANLVASAS